MAVVTVPHRVPGPDSGADCVVDDRDVVVVVRVVVGGVPSTPAATTVTDPFDDRHTEERSSVGRHEMTTGRPVATFSV